MPRFAQRALSPSGMLLAALLLVALGLRLYNVNWDQSQHLHPDERFISSVMAEVRLPGSSAQYFDSSRSELNPYNHRPTFVYGTLPLLITKAVAEWLDRDQDGTTHRSGDAVLRAVQWLGAEPDGPDGTRTFDGGYNANLVGRVLSAFFDTGTVLVTYLLGRVTLSRTGGLVAATFIAFSPLHIQQSHFFTADSFLVFFSTLSLLFLVIAVRRKDARILVAAGATIGCALACKVSGLLLIGPFGLAVSIGAYTAIRAGWLKRTYGTAVRMGAQWFTFAALAAIVGLAVFRVAQPYAFGSEGFLNTFQWDVQREDLAPGNLIRARPLYPDRWLALDDRFVTDLTNLRRIQQGSDFPPNVQWIGRAPYAWPMENIIRWGFGPFAAAAAALGLIVVGHRIHARALDPTLGIVAAWAVLVFGFYGDDFVSSMRYFLPGYPAFGVLAGLGVTQLVAFAAQGSRRNWVRGLLTAPAVATVAGSIFVGLAFTSGVYGPEISRIAASRWMLAELPPGTVISHENWDDGLPIQAPGFPPNPFPTIDLDLYGTDSRDKILGLARQLDEIEVIVLSSNRLADSIPRHPARFPSTTRYFRALEDGSLGYEKIAEFRNEPRLFGVSWSDGAAEEAFTVYDHPTVRIYRKTGAFSSENTLRVLQPDAADAAVHAEPGDADTNGLMLTPEGYEAQQEGGTWSSVFSTDGPFARWPWVWWFLWLELASLAVIPWWTWMFRGISDRGYGLAKVAGPVLVALVAWLAVAWGLLDFSRGLAWGSLVALLLAGTGIGWRRRRGLFDEMRLLRGTWLRTELVFAGVFAFFLLLRASNPDIWFHPTGGEKPMEVAYLTAVVRSTELPPYDPWLAGGYLNYYYFGWFILAVPIRAFQTVPEVAFNLAVPSFAAMAAAASFSCVSGMLATVNRGRSWNGLGVRYGGLIAVLLSVFAGNLDAAHQTIERLQRISEWRPQTGFAPLDGLARLLGGSYAWLISGKPMGTFDWWRSSRVHFGSNDITEFPYWSFLFSDVHPHLMAIPLFIGLAGLAIGYVQSCRVRLERQAVALCIGLGVLLAIIRMGHTWDLPTAAALAAAAVCTGQLLRSEPSWARVKRAALHLVAIAATAQLVALPYLQHAEVFNQGIVRSPATTPPQQFFVHFGVFIMIGALYIGIRYLELSREGHGNVLVRFLAIPERALATATLLTIVVLLAGERGYAVLAAGTAAVILTANLLFSEVGRRSDTGRLMAAFFLLLGLVVAVSVELVTVKDDIARMNAVFKFSLQAWHLLALGSAFAAVYSLSFISNELSLATSRVAGLWWRLSSRTLAIAFVLALMFPLMGTVPRQQARFGDLPMTLDGLRYMEGSPTFQESAGEPGAEDDPVLHLAEDLPLIWWLRENVEGSPTIVEAVGPLYHWTGRYSVNTGLPAVVGWDWHQIQQRGTLAGQVGVRREATRLFYSGADSVGAERFLQRYDVAYVIVGPWERALGTPDGIETIGRLPALRAVFRSGENVIYEVDKEALAKALIDREVVNR